MPPRGLAYGLIAYGLWGMFPLYFPLLEPSGAVEILAHRMVWSLLVSAIILTVVRGWRAIVLMPPRVWGLVVAASCLIAVNWVIYIWAVNTATSSRPPWATSSTHWSACCSGCCCSGAAPCRQWCAVGLGVAAVAGVGRRRRPAPWIALTLAPPSALRLVKKVIPLTPTASLTAEGLVQFVPAVGYLAVISAAGTSTFLTAGTGHALLLAASGLITCVPLLAFAAAAQALPLSVLGLLQYLTPVIQFLLGVLWFGEPMPAYRWIGFVLVWSALVLFTADAMRQARRSAVARRAD